MNESWVGSCGLLLGGHGEWETKLDLCRLVVSADGLVSALSILTGRWDTRWKVGLFQNDYHPHLKTNLSKIVPCDFSGYSGLLATFGWSLPAMIGVVAQSQAHEVKWTHDGGAVGNFVYGYYAVDLTNTLMWAERFCPAPIAIGRSGLSVRIKPTFYVTNDPPA